MVPETYRWGEYNSGGRFSVFSRDLSAKALARNSKGYQGGGDPVCEPCFLEWSEGASEVNKLQSAKAAGREIGGFMLAITGATSRICEFYQGVTKVLRNDCKQI